MLPECKIIRTELPPHFKRYSSFKKSKLENILQKIYGLYLNIIVVPDMYAGWEKVIDNHLEANPLEDIPDIIVSSSGSYSAHISAYNLSKKFKTPFIAELGDPWTFNPIWPATLPHRIYKNKKIESQILSKVSSIVVTTEKTAEIYQKWFGNKFGINVVTMGYSSNDFNKIKKYVTEKTINITYVGVAYRTGRNILSFLDALNSINHKNDIQFNLIGPHSAYFEEYAKKNKYNYINFEGRVSYEKSIEHIKEAGILVIIGNTGGVQVPGKAFMYLASGRPIVLLAQESEESDPTWQLLKQFPGTIFCPMVDKDIQECFNNILDNYEILQSESYQRLKMKEFKDLEWNRIGRKFAKIVEKELSV